MKDFKITLSFPIKDGDVTGGDRGRAWFDIETIKVDVNDPPRGWPNGPTGKPLPRRMKPFMIGVSYIEFDEICFELYATMDEKELIRWFENTTEGGTEVAYWSFNRYDEVVLKGLYTNARTRNLTEPGNWPCISKDYYCDFVDVWRNEKRKKGFAPKGFDKKKRGDEISGEMIAKKGVKFEIEMIYRMGAHCLRDVVDLMLRDSDYTFSDSLVKRMKESFDM